MKGPAWSPTQGLFWGFCLGILSGAGPFCVQLFAPPLAFSICGCPAEWHSFKWGHSTVGNWQFFYRGSLKRHKQLLLVNNYKTLYFEKLILQSLAARLEATLRGKYFIHNGKHVVSPCWPSQHGIVVPDSFAVDTPMTCHKLNLNFLLWVFSFFYYCSTITQDHARFIEMFVISCMMNCLLLLSL